jgi:hypothetical protein
MTGATRPVGGSPLLFTLRHEGQQGGAGLQSSGRAFVVKMGFSLGISRCPFAPQGKPALKRAIRVEAFPGALKRSFPHINVGAPTNLLGSSHCISNRYKVRIEIVVSHSKQTIGTNSNRNSFRGSAKRRDENNWRGGGSARAKRDPSSRNVIRDPNTAHQHSRKARLGSARLRSGQAR